MPTSGKKAPDWVDGPLVNANLAQGISASSLGLEIAVVTNVLGAQVPGFQAAAST